jgi:hypothetical protein
VDEHDRRSVTAGPVRDLSANAAQYDANRHRCCLDIANIAETRSCRPRAPRSVLPLPGRVLLLIVLNANSCHCRETQPQDFGSYIVPMTAIAGIVGYWLAQASGSNPDVAREPLGHALRVSLRAEGSTQRLGWSNEPHQSAIGWPQGMRRTLDVDTALVEPERWVAVGHQRQIASGR